MTWKPDDAAVERALSAVTGGMGAHGAPSAVVDRFRSVLRAAIVAAVGEQMDGLAKDRDEGARLVSEQLTALKTLREQRDEIRAGIDRIVERLEAERAKGAA